MNHPTHHDAPGRIIGLDGLRAVSIVLVLVGHGFPTVPGSSDYGVIDPYIGNATLGVQTFFVISGFLITYLLRKEWKRAGSINLAAFYVRRVLRIFPALYTYLLVLAIIRTIGWIDTTWSDIAIAGTFLTNYKHLLGIPTNDGYWFVGHFWTLSLEEQFYLFWPATILAVGIVRCQWFALLIVLAAPVLRVGTYFLWPEVRPQLGMMLHTAADPIMVGCLAALWFDRATLTGIMGRLSSWGWLLSACLFLLIVSPWLVVQFRGAYLITVGLSLNSVAIAFIMLWVIRHPASVPSRLLSMPMLRHIGLLSYSLYLWQQLFLTQKNESWTGAFPVNFIMCFVAAEISYWAVERPFLRLRDRFSRRQQSRDVPGDKITTDTNSTLRIVN